MGRAQKPHSFAGMLLLDAIYEERAVRMSEPTPSYNHVMYYSKFHIPSVLSTMLTPCLLLCIFFCCACDVVYQALARSEGLVDRVVLSPSPANPTPKVRTDLVLKI
jgi:hypothetical protein